nr:hypothetical transcript [Hymenolepis microstoma]
MASVTESYHEILDSDLPIMNGKETESPSNSPASRSTHSKDDTQVMISPSRIPSRPCDSIPSLSSFLTAESDKTVPGGLSPCYSSPSLPTHGQPSYNDIEKDARTVDSGLQTTFNDAEDGDLDGVYEEEELCSDASDLFGSSSNFMPNEVSSNNIGNCETSDLNSTRTFNASTSAIDKISGDGEVSYAYSSKKSTGGPKRKLSNWYQVKRETFVKSYHDKVNYFKKTFDGTPVDTDRFLVDYSCALVKNKNGLLLLGRMYITDKWICFYSKIIYELKIYLAVDDIETVSKAKTARLIPNAIQITLKSNKERYFFTSFSSRERTFAFLKKVCENNRNGGGLLPTESEVGNMEELLCQVQDVYGDESLALLDFEDADDEEVYPPNRNERVTSTTELTEFPSTDSVDGSLNNSVERVEVRLASKHYRPQSRYNPRGSRNHLSLATTDDEASILLNRPHRSVSSTHLPPTTTIGSLASSYDLSELSESTNSIASIEENGKGVTETVDSGLQTTFNDAEDGDLDGVYEEEELCSDASDLFGSSSNFMPNEVSSNNIGNCETSDLNSTRTFNASTSAIDKISGDGEVSYAYSSKKSTGGPKRKLSNWYQVKRETFVKSYHDKVNYFKKTFDGTPIYLAVDDIETVSKAKTARLIPNAIQITLKSNKERYFFTSFSSRERTFAFLKKVCENNRNGGVGNMEELLCQVQDVYGDESLALLDFEDADDEEVYPPNRNERVTSTTELTEFPSTDSVDGSLNNSVERVEVRLASKHYRPQSRYNPRGSRNHLSLATTDDEASILLNRPHRSVSSTHLPPTTTIGSLASSYDLSELSESTNSIASIEENGKDQLSKGIVMNFDKRQCEGTAENSSEYGRPQKKTNKPPVIQYKESSLDNAEISRQRSSSGHSKKSDNPDGIFDPDLSKESYLGPVSCGSGHKHPGRTYAAIDINVSVDALFAFLFTDSLFFSDFCEHRGTFDVRQKPWPAKPWVDNGKDIHRNISYVLTLKQRLGPRTCRAFESQTLLLSETRPGMRYVVDATVTNEAVPLCNSFHVTTRYCLLRRSATVSHLIITSEVVYDRPVFFGAKSIIESTCRSNLTDNFTDLVDHLTKASQNLTEKERITGGALARPYRPKEKKSLINLAAKSCPGNGIISSKQGLGSNSDEVNDHKDSIPDLSKGSAIGHHHLSTRGLSIPQVLLYPNEQSDGRWMFFMAVFGLCVLLSVVFNRYQNVEKITADHLEYTARAAVRQGSAPTSCCEELDSIRMLIESFSGVLSQMRTTLDLLERRLDQLSTKACKTVAKNVFLGHYSSIAVTREVMRCI